jgi:hypothetical protein
MYFRLNIKTDYDAVFTINGSFTEGRKTLSLSNDEIYYITVFPLNAALLPYTVKLANGFVASNDDLARVCEISTTQRILKFSPRYAFVYASGSENHIKETSLPLRFFNAVKTGNLSEARSFLSTDLSSSVSSDALSSFFDDYFDLIENDGKFYLVDGNGKASKYRFTIKENLIDDVSEE